MLISNSEDNTSFKEILNSILNEDQYNKGERAWLLYLQDHRGYIIERSKLVEITPNEMAYYKYRIRKYLSYKGYNSDYDKIFRIINRLPLDMQFNENVTKVYLPDSTVIAELRRSYQTLKNQILKI